MSRAYTFDLERAIAAWRRRMEATRSFLPEDLDELERHLRDQVTASRDAEEEAFHRAMRGIGDYGAVESAYRRVYWGKIRRSHTITQELAWRYGMLGNYAKIALRTLRREWGYALINVLGLAAGLASCILIVLFVRDELSYDGFHANADRIVRVVLDLHTPRSESDLTTTPAAFGPAAVQDFAQVQSAVRIYRPTQISVAVDDRAYRETGFMYADSTMFEVFSFPLVEGDPATVLDAPDAIVVTESAARRYFGDAEPVGRSLIVGDTLEFHVSGVARDVLPESHMHFDLVAPMASWEAQVPSIAGQWAPHMYYTYLLLAPGTSLPVLESEFPALVERNVQLTEGWTFDFSLQPLRSIHLHSHRDGELEANGRADYVTLFGLIAVFILLIACINFINLSTARASRRMGEVGMRKVLGAHRRQLVTQFLGEAFVMSVGATMLALVVIVLALPAFNAVTGKSLSIRVLGDWIWVAGLPAFAIAVGILAGTYPAFVLSGFKPLAGLRGQAGMDRGAGGATRLRKALVVFQFAISVFLIAGAGVVLRQLDYMRSRPLGFSPDRILVLQSLTGHDRAAAETFRDQVLQQAGVRQATLSMTVPGRGMLGLSFQAESMPEDDWRASNVLFADTRFVSTYGMEMAAGRDFSDDMATDSTRAFLINEAMAAELGWTPEEAVGKRAALRSGSGRIVGVVRDFHYTTLEQSIEPLVIVPNPALYGTAPLYVSVRVTDGDLPGTLDRLEERWRAVVPQRPFDYFFLDADFDRQYRAEDRLASIVGIFAGLAVLIACLGLFGLAAFTAERRTKEIGLRKALGASVPGILLLLSREFLVLVGIGFVIATPAAYLVMDRWLDDFAYRTPVPWQVFVLTGLAALAIAWLTVSYQAVRAATTRPVESLRYE